jgi:hypothetical protein
MTNFDHILNWKLNAGSHEFPGPNGGTCINEAAIVAAGFPYQAVNSAEDMPPCFSRVIAQYALALNDFMPDSQRQQLMPYVVRLAGTADTPAVERQRAEYLAMQAVTVFAARALDVAQLPDHATACSRSGGVGGVGGVVGEGGRGSRSGGVGGGVGGAGGGVGGAGGAVGGAGGGGGAGGVGRRDCCARWSSGHRTTKRPHRYASRR